MATRMQQRRGTEAQWDAANPVLGAGEIGFETDTGKFKIGDGTNQWGDLAYFLDSTDAQGALEGYVLTTDVGVANGVASLDANGNVPVEQLGNIIDGAPELLNTLNELAAALGDDADFVTTVNASITALQAGVQQRGEEIDAVETIANSADQRSITNESDIDAVEANVATLQSNLATAEGNITSLQTSVSSLEGQTLDTRLTAAEGDIDTLQGDVSTLQSDVALKAPIDSPVFTGNVELPSTTTIGNLSSTEIGYLTTVTSDVQTQLDAKLDSGTASSTYATLAGPTFTGTVVLPSTTSVGTVTDAEIAHLSGVTSAIQTQIDAKLDSTTASSTYAPIDSPTFTTAVTLPAATDIGSVTATEIGYLDGVTSAIQTQIDAKADLAGATFSGNVTVTGDFTVSGTTTTVSAQDLVVSDPLIYIGEGNSANLVDLGLVSSFNDGTYQHAGIVRDSSDSKWKLFKGVTDEPTTTINFAQGSLDDLALNNVEVSGVVFSDGTQTKQGVPSITEISQKTDSYTLAALTERDTIIEINKSTATTLTIPTDATVDFPVGTTLDIIRTGSGDVTIAGASGVTVNATPGLKLRAQWSSATLLKRAADTWLVYGDLAS